MTAPGGGGADEIREQLADWTGAWTQAERDDLLDVVRALIAKGAAAELRAAADWLTGSGPNGSLPGGCAPDQTSDGLSWMEDVTDRDSALDWCQMSLRDRADAPDGPR